MDALKSNFEIVSLNPTGARPATSASLANAADSSIAVSFRLFQWFFAPAMLYSVVKYNLLGAVSWTDLPLYVVNKALSLAAVFMIVTSVAIGPLARAKMILARRAMPLRKYIGLIGFGGALLHSIISLVLLNATYYPKFFDAATGRLHGAHQLAILAGLVAMAILAVLSITSIDSVRRSMGAALWKSTHSHVTLTLSLMAGHLLFIGAKAWMTPEKWPMAMPPITLLAFVPILIVLGYRFRYR